MLALIFTSLQIFRVFTFHQFIEEILARWKRVVRGYATVDEGDGLRCWTTATESDMYTDDRDVT